MCLPYTSIIFGSSVFYVHSMVLILMYDSSQRIVHGHFVWRTAHYINYNTINQYAFCRSYPYNFYAYEFYMGFLDTYQKYMLLDNRQIFLFYEFGMRYVSSLHMYLYMADLTMSQRRKFIFLLNLIRWLATSESFFFLLANYGFSPCIWREVG